MSELSYWDDTLTTQLLSIRTLLNSLDNNNDSLSVIEKSNTLEHIKIKLREANDVQKSYKMETRLVYDPVQRREYELKLMELSEELTSCWNDWKAWKGGVQRGELFAGVASSGSGSGQHDNYNGQYGNDTLSAEETGDGMLTEMNTIQEKTKTSIQNTKQLVQASKEVGATTMEELSRQRQQLEATDQEVMRVDDNLVRADKLIKTFGKRMATDRFIQCSACVNIVLLVAVIIFVALKKSHGKPEDVSPSPFGGRFLRGPFLGKE